MQKSTPGGKTSNWYETGHDEALHIYMRRSSNLKMKVKLKAFQLGYRVNEYLLRLLEDATKDVILPKNKSKAKVKSPKIKPKQ